VKPALLDEFDAKRTSNGVGRATQRIERDGGNGRIEESIELPTARPHPSGHLHFGQTLFLHRLRELLGNHFLNRVVFARLKYSLVGKEVIERLSADSAFLFSGH
jgi:hypothetical protein